MTHRRLAEGYEGKEVLYFDEPDILFFELSFIGEEANDIDLIYLVFFTGGNKERGPFGFGRQDRRWRQLNGFGPLVNIGRQLFLRGQDEDSGSAGLHPGRSAVAMDEYFRGGWQMIMDDISDVRHIQPPGGKVGGDQYVGTAVPEFRQSTVSFGLFKCPMIKYIDDPFLL